MIGSGFVAAQTAGDKPTVLKLDPALDVLVSSDAKLQTVYSGYGFTEGIVWVPNGRLSPAQRHSCQCDLQIDAGRQVLGVHGT